MYKELQKDYERKLSWARSLGIGAELVLECFTDAATPCELRSQVMMKRMSSCCDMVSPLQIRFPKALTPPLQHLQSCPPGSTFSMPPAAGRDIY